MTPIQMAEIHSRAMSVPSPWTSATFANFLSSPDCVVFAREAEQSGIGGFALGRIVLDEAELLTIAVDPECQGRGLGRACLAGFLDSCRMQGVSRVFLEVADTNHVARHLYRTAGFCEVGVRHGYYQMRGATAIDARLLSLAIDS